MAKEKALNDYANRKFQQVYTHKLNPIALRCIYKLNLTAVSIN
jgi:hypothetical protein